MPLQVTEETPESESETLPVTEIEEAEEVDPSAGEVIEIAGGVLSRLIVAEAEDTFPATSTAVPAITWLEPSVLTVAGGVQVATPDRESAQENVTVTFELFQELEFAAGEALAAIVGAVLSIFTVILVLAVLPALSVAVPEITVEPSVITV
jgi:hypothetical protein